MKNAFIFTVLTILFASSCTKTVNEFGAASPQQLVVFAEVEAGQSRPMVSIQSTFSNSEEVIFLSKESYVQIFVNDDEEPKDFRPVERDNRPEDKKDDESLWWAGTELKIEEGNAYRLFIKDFFEEFDAVEAVSYVPVSGELNVTNLTSPEIITSENGLKSQFKCDFTIIDKDINSTYYHLTPYLLLNDDSKLYLNIEDVLLNENAVIDLRHRDGILIDNSIVDGASDVSLNMSIPHKLEDLDLLSMFVNFELRTVPKDYFLYHRSISQNIDSGESVFSPPTVTHSNFSGGYGIFATYSSTLDSIAIN